MKILKLSFKKATFAILSALVCFGVTTAYDAKTSFASSYFNSEKDIISREAWGADESYLFLKSNSSTPDIVQLEDNFAVKYADELKISKKITHDSKGREFKWELEYPAKITKFIIHHTATIKDLDNPRQAIRNIYYYHAVTRGWGDIGYNYIIDSEGRVYEGRYGGEGVVGGHAGPGNIGSIGIAILGDYDKEGSTVPKEALESLAKLIAIKSKIYNINPEGYGVFRGKNLPSIIGHRDVMSTACPGENMYKLLPMIGSMAKSNIDSSKPKFVKDFDFLDKSDVYYLEFSPQETKTVTIKFENIGKETWGDGTYLVVNKNEENEKIVSFTSREGVKLAMMNEKSVSPGKTATFTFKIKSSAKAGQIFMDLTVVANGRRKMSDYKVLPAKVNMPIYTYDLVSYDKLPSTMNRGEKFEGTVKLKNTGNLDWTKLGEDMVYLKIGSDTVGFLTEKEVKKGETGTFSVAFSMPRTFGTYSQEMKLVTKDDNQLKGGAMKYSTLISRKGSVGIVESKNEHTVFQKGGSYMLWVKIQNIGSTTWKTNDIILGYVKNQDITITKEHFTKKEVKPGETVEINVVVKVANNASAKKNSRLTIVPRINKNKLVKNMIFLNYDIAETTAPPPSAPSSGESGSTAKPIIAPSSAKPSTQSAKKLSDLTVAEKSEIFAYKAGSVNVSESELSEKNGGKIRVRISFFSSPLITSNKEFYLYDSKNTKLQTFKAGDEVTLGIVGTKYSAKVSSKLLRGDDPYVVRSQEGAYLEIKNFSRISAWNSAYNDNKFRGDITLKMVDEKYAVINELELEDYLKGLAEEPNSEPMEKIKAITVAARSYAKFYMHYAEKFPGKPYDLNDDPAVCQKYLGYGYESRAPNVVKATKETEGQVITYLGQLIKAPYFSSSDGKTKSSTDVWKWSAPYLVSVDDPYCKGGSFSGHGVGMSGCGSKAMAQNGYTYKDILKYYYTGTETTKLWNL